jgi:hypothetical protein
VTDPAKDIPEVIYWASQGEDLRIILPSEILRTWGAFGFYGGWNPMIPALQNDAETFHRYFDYFQPKNLSDMYFLGERFDPVVPGPMEQPWLFMPNQQPMQGENGTGAAAHPPKFSRLFGPSSAETIGRQFIRTRRVMQSIQDKGYRPDRHGDIQGYFLHLDGAYRFMIKGGKHRATVLTHLGCKSIPVQMRPSWPRVIYGEHVRDWPLVRNGRMSEDFALAVIRRFFEFDGTQQRDHIFGRTS